MRWDDIAIKYDDFRWNRFGCDQDMIIKVDSENLLNNKMKKKEGYSNLFKGYLDFVPNVKKIIHSGRCTIVIWTDGSKTIVKQSEDDDWDEYAAFCAAFCKKVFGSTSAVKRMIDKKTVPYRPTNKEKKEDKEINKASSIIAKINDWVTIKAGAGEEEERK